MKKHKYTKKTFPFSGGIQWTIKDGKYLVPEMNMNTWNNIVSSKTGYINIIAYGGIFEAFLSQFIANSIAKVELYKQIYWSGNPEFKSIIQFPYKQVSEKLVSKYPAPIFFDKEENIYFNCLNNYIWTKSLTRLNDYEDRTNLCEQIIRNCLLNFDSKNIPKLTLNKDKYNNWCKLNNFNDNKSYVVVCLDSTNYSQHQHLNMLGWNAKNVLHLSGLIQSLGMDVVVCAENKGELHGRRLFIAPCDFEIMLPLIEKSQMILSKEIDYLLISLMISKAAVIYKGWSGIKKTAYDLFKSADILESEGILQSFKNIEPYDVYRILKE